MAGTEPELVKAADTDLAREATLTGIFFLVAWLFVVYTTTVADDLPRISIIGMLLFGALISVRLVLGLGFERLYERLTPPLWRRSFGAVILLNGLTWGCLAAIILWHYFPSWTAYLCVMLTAGLAAGGAHSLNTHLRLLQGFQVLAVVPSVITLIATRSADSSVLGVLLAIFTLFMVTFSRQLNRRYWDALRSAHQLKEALTQSEAANRAKDQFLANMSHEIRTPLNAVLGLAQTGKRISHDSESRGRFGRILKSGSHLLGIINEILDLSKLDAGRLRIEARPFRLNALVRDAFNLAKSSAQHRALGLELEMESGLPEWVIGDPLRLRQVLVNLLDNAVKFTPRGQVRLKVYPARGEICFAVIDTGIGIGKAELSRIFTPFEQADGTATRQYGGTGLGLAISRDLARLMGGEIGVESVPGTGSTFTLRLPLDVTESPGDVHPQESLSGRSCLAGVRVLIVDDDELNRQVVGEMLEYEGAIAVPARDGPHAVELVREAGSGEFNIVLMDVQMPRMDGYEATRRIHAIVPDLPVVGLTAHAMDEERTRCLAAGMAAHIAKPVDSDGLVSMILRLVPLATEQNEPQSAMKGGVEGMAESPLPEFESLPGIDVTAAMNRLHCDWSAFRRILLTFYRNRAGSIDQLYELLDRGALAEARDIAHGIKGSSGIIGASKLCREANVLQDACESGDREIAMAQLAPFRQSLDEVIDGLARLQEQENASPRKTIG